MSKESDAINSMVEAKAQENKQQAEAGAAETPEQVAEREKAEAAAKTAGQETPEQKIEREKVEAAAKATGTQETPEQKIEREKVEAAAKNASQETPEQKVEREKAEVAAKAASTDDPINKLLKDLNVKSVDELKDKIEKGNRTQETPEQKKKREDVYNAQLVSYAVENDLLKSEEVTKLQEVRTKEDDVLVFEQFADDMEEEIVEDESLWDDDEEKTDEKIAEKIKEAFDKKYPLDSKNNKLKAKAESRIKREAEAIRSPLESSYNIAKERYDNEISIRNDYPVYQKNVNKILQEVVPNKVSFYSDKYGEENVSIEIDVPEDVKKEILESLTENIVKNPETFLSHKKGNLEEIQKKMKDSVDYILWQKLSKEGNAKLLEKGLVLGRKEGSDTGAKNSFATNQAGAGNQGAAAPVDAKQAVLDSTKAKK